MSHSKTNKIEGFRSIQELADSRVKPEYRRAVVDMDTALKNLGWFPLPEDGKPICCGRPVEVATFIGWPYSAMCTQCHKFMFSALAPNFGNSWVQSVDSEQYDFDDPEQWIWGKER